MRDGEGLTLGRSMGVSGEGDKLVSTEVHESTHLWQQERMGWANFYGKTILQYAKALFSGNLSTLLKNWGTVYSTKGTLEWQAVDSQNYYMRYIYE